jgi:hypothetical protein
MSEGRIAGFNDHESIVAMRRRHAEIGMRMQSIALYGLEELERKVAAGEQLDMSADDVKKMLEAAAKFIAGSPTKFRR